MSEIPSAIIDRDKIGVETITYYGVPVSELDRDGLLAALNMSEKRARMGFANFNNMVEFNRFVDSRNRVIESGMNGLSDQPFDR